MEHEPAATILDFTRLSTVLFDVDGTLIDSNAAHADTWAQALSEHGVVCTAARVRPLIGMGGDKLLPAITSLEDDSPLGRAIATRKKELFAARLPHLAPTPGARALIVFLRATQLTIVVATSAGDEEMQALLRQAGVADLIPRRASKDDANQSKPDPDIVHAALAKADAVANRTLMIGDTPYDIEAAGRAGVETIALRCGGFWTDTDLRHAQMICHDPAHLLEVWQADSRVPTQGQA